MDMLFKRYACPFSFIDQMLKVGRFEDFIDEFIDIQNEEIKDQTLWEFYLHHEWLSETFESFKNKIQIPSKKQSSSNLEATVRFSKSILDDFIPD